MAEAFHGVPLARTEDLRDTESIPPPVLQYYQRLLASQPARRLNPIKLLESAVFKTKLVRCFFVCLLLVRGRDECALSGWANAFKPTCSVQFGRRACCNVLAI